MRTFLDSNILLAAYNAREPESEAALAIMLEGHREFVGSDYLKLELYPFAVRANDPDQVEFFDRYFAALVQLVETSPVLVGNALTLAGRYGLGAGDALLARAAMDAAAREFVTKEAPTKPL